jgi:hypothetical protein
MNFLKRLFGGGAAKHETPPAINAEDLTKPMAAKPKPGTPLPAANEPPDDMTLIDPVAKDTWKADQWRAQGAGPSEYDKKK